MGGLLVIISSFVLIPSSVGLQFIRYLQPYEVCITQAGLTELRFSFTPAKIHLVVTAIITVSHASLKNILNSTCYALCNSSNFPYLLRVLRAMLGIHRLDSRQ